MDSLGVVAQAIYRTPSLYVLGLHLLASALAYFGYRQACKGKDKKKLSGTALVAMNTRVICSRTKASPRTFWTKFSSTRTI